MLRVDSQTIRVYRIGERPAMVDLGIPPVLRLRTAAESRWRSAVSAATLQGVPGDDRLRPNPLLKLFDFDADSMSVTEQPSQPERLRREPPRDLYPWFLTIQDIDRDYGGQLDWHRFFGSDRPVQLDIGSGRGLFLFNAATTQPDQNFLGIEIDYKEGRRAAQRLKKRQLDNARVLGGDVKIPLTRMIAPQSVAAVHVYFPDPWWKLRHRKRRVFNAEFVDLCARILTPGGLLHSWTDVEEYFGVISELMHNHPAFETLPAPGERSPEHDMDYQTSFERKGRKAGTEIHRGLWRRKELAADAS